MKSETVDLPCPRGLSISETDYDLTIARKWFSGNTIVSGIAAAVWCKFSVDLAQSAVQSPRLKEAVIALSFLCVGAYLVYHTVAHLLNTTRIAVGRGLLSVRTGPIPWRGNVSIQSRDVVQVFCEEYVSKSHKARRYARNYTVYAIAQDHARIKLVKNLLSKEEALYIEERVERFLKIEDKKVKGEVG